MNELQLIACRICDEQAFDVLEWSLGRPFLLVVLGDNGASVESRHSLCTVFPTKLRGRFHASICCIIRGSGFLQKVVPYEFSGERKRVTSVIPVVMLCVAQNARPH